MASERLPRSSYRLLWLRAVVIRATMASPRTRVPRKLRERRGDMAVAKWLVPAPRCFTLPLAVRRNRLRVPLCVFCLGMTAPFSIIDKVPRGGNPIF